MRTLAAGVAGVLGAVGVPKAEAPCTGVAGRPAQVSGPLREPQAGTQQVARENHLGFCLSPDSTRTSGPPHQRPHGHLLTRLPVSMRCPGRRGGGEEPPVQVPRNPGLGAAAAHGPNWESSFLQSPRPPPPPQALQPALCPATEFPLKPLEVAPGRPQKPQETTLGKDGTRRPSAHPQSGDHGPQDPRSPRPSHSFHNTGSQGDCPPRNEMPGLRRTTLPAEPPISGRALPAHAEGGEGPSGVWAARLQRERLRRLWDTGWGRLRGCGGKLKAEQGSVSSARGAELSGSRESRAHGSW